ncbi:MAG: TolC family protein [Planctomycetia bacterium]|nr:TolC family protein [Planctomycetia bacterium]
MIAGVFSADRLVVRAQSPEPNNLAAPLWAGQRPQRLPPVERAVNSAQVVGFLEPAPAAPYQATRAVAVQPEEVLAQKLNEAGGFAIDLPTALRLADAGNLQVAFAREQVNQAMAQVEAANALWLPSLRGGTNYNRHEGAIQRVEGAQIINSRGAFYAGLGAGGYGAASPTVPGLYANFHLVDALFQPLAARQFAGSRNRAAAAATNDVLLQVTLAYFELLRAGEDVVISQGTRNDSQQLADVTAAYAETGAGLKSDANRARAELAVRENDVARSREAQRVASARLAQLLRLDPTVALNPAEPLVVPIEVVALDVPVKELIAQGLSQRPELAEHRLLVAEAVQRLRRERFAVLIPSIVMGTSYGGMGAGINGTLADFHDRLDVDALAYWEMRNLGFGEVAARRGAQSAVRQTQFRQMAVMDQVAREVVEAHAQVQARKGQMATAKLGVEAALASQQQNLDRIEQAKGLPIEVLQAIQALAQARREYLRTVIDYNAAQFALYRALGWPVKLPRELEANGGG